MQNIDLSALNTKKQFTINGDENRILELDVTDLNVIQRYNEAMPKLKALEEKLRKLPLVNDDDEVDEMALKINTFAEVDKGMREFIDFIFDSNVCEVCAPHGSMYDPIKGRMRYEILLDIIIGLYEDSLQKELQKLEKNVSKHSSKYTKK